MDGVITFLNTTGKSFVSFSSSMLIQSSVLIIVLLLLDAFLRKRVRVVVLYGIWMLVLVKLVLPTTFSFPTGLVYWFGDKVSSIVSERASSIPKQMGPTLQRTKPESETIPYGLKITDLSSFRTSPEPIAGTTANFTAAASPATTSLSWQGFAFLGWLSVGTAMVLLLIRRMVLVRGLLAQSKSPDDSIVNIFEQCRKQIGVRRSVCLELSPVAVSPSVCGLFRPRILIPQNLPRRLGAQDLRPILLHELVHIKRGDVLVSLIQTILQIAYFYNPLLWVANVIIRKVREQAVDEMVLVALGEQAEDYPETLLNISRMTFGRPILKLRLIGVVESKKALERRIMIMLNRPVPKSSKLGICGLIVIVVIGSVILPMGYNPTGQAALAASVNDGRDRGGIIVPGVRVGDYMIGMSKDEVLKRLGEPKSINYEGEKYNLNNLPKRYYIHFDDISFNIDGDVVIGIGVHSPVYKFTNGLRVGDSEQKVKKALGSNFRIRESEWKDILSYKNEGLMFEIHKQDRTVMEIGISRIPGGHGERGAPDQQEKSKHTIVPGLRVGEYTLGMSKDDVLRKLGEPETIQLDEDEVVRRGEERYNLNNLPKEYIMSFDNISFWFEDDSVGAISVRSPLYKLSSGFGVGDSEQKIKQEFGEDFRLEKVLGKDFLCYHAKGLAFEIHKKNQTVAEIVVYKPESDNGADQQEKSKHTIVPGLRVGTYTLDMSKDDVLRKLGEPETIQLDEDEVIHRGDPKYSLNNLPSDCILTFGDVSFLIKDDSVKAIFVRSPLYKLSNGLGVGDSEQKIKQAFGEDFHLEESLGKDYLCYDAKWLAFEIDKKNQTVAEIVTFQPKVDRPDSAQVALVRKAASEGRILYKVTTPEEFKEIAGEPTREWTDGDDVIYMEYPGIEVKFVCRNNSPYVVIYVLCNRVGIDIGQDRPIDEGDLDQQPDRSDRDAPDSDKIIMLSEQPPGPITFPKIDRKPKPAGWRRGEMKSLPKYDPDLRNPGQVDLRCYDLSKLDLRNSIENLMYANFDDRTVWPAPNQMPSNFNRQTIMELGKNPGLGVRTLHKRGITGKGVGVAIIDQPLLTKHQEYADCLRLYEENNVRDGTHSAMHGPAVASIAVGKTVGVAPDADLYYIASWELTRDDDPRDNFVFRAQAIQRLLEINRQLPANRKIRVISNSIGWSPSQDGYDEITAACEEAKAAGIFVVTCGIIEPYGFDFGGLGRHPLANPDSFKSYGPCLDWAKIFYRSIPGRDSDALWIPEDSRTTASPTGSDEYVFYRQGGASWCAPYIAGVYALTVQVEPEITPERFWALAMKTGRTIELEHEGHKRSFGPIIDPVALISTLQKK